jgi:hypothetical protein
MILLLVWLLQTIHGPARQRGTQANAASNFAANQLLPRKRQIAARDEASFALLLRCSTASAAVHRR